MNPQLAFVAHLRRTRQRAGVSLEQIALQTRVKCELLEAFEENDLTNWPRGLYARVWVRGYAQAVGLDPGDTVDEFCRLYLHGDRRARSTMRELAAIGRDDSYYEDDVPMRRRRSDTREIQPTWYTPVVRVWRSLRLRVTVWLSLFARPGRVH